MKKLEGKLPLIAFVVAAFAAVAFTSPNELPGNSTLVWTPDPQNPGEYIDITAISNQNQYRCEDSSLECRVAFTDDDPENGEKTVLQFGDFIAL